MIIGSLILGLGFTACNTKSNNSTTSKTISIKDSNNIESLTESYIPIAENNSDTTKNDISKKKTRDIKNNNVDSKADSIDSFILSLKPDKIIEEIDTTEHFEIISTCYKVSVNYSDSIYEVVEQMPVFSGGNAELFKIIYNNLEFPNSSIKNKIHGRVIVRFVVTRWGTIDKINVIKSLSPDCDKEAIRVVGQLTKWNPGRHDGINVNVWFTLPINFKLL